MRWLASYKYMPLDTLKRSLVENTQLVRVPYYHFVTGYRADYSVNIGDLKREPRTVYKTVYEDGRAKQVPHTEWVHRTEWRPYLSNGHVSGNFAMKYADSVPTGGDFLGFLNDAAWRLEELVSASDEDDDAETLPFARGTKEAYDQVVDAPLKEQISKQVRKALPGDTFRDLTYRWYLSGDEWSRVYLPYWRFSLDYMGTPYACLIDGRNIDRIEGLRPTDIELRKSVNENLKPLWIASGTGLPLAALIWMVGGSAAVVPWLLGIIALIVVAVGVVSLKRRYEALRDAQHSRSELVEQLLSSLGQNVDASNPKAIDKRDAT